MTWRVPGDRAFTQRDGISQPPGFLEAIAGVSRALPETRAGWPQATAVGAAIASAY